jgi:MORN repeat variant
MPLRGCAKKLRTNATIDTVRRQKGARSGAEEDQWGIETAGTERARHAPLTGTDFAWGIKGSRTRKSRTSGPERTFRRIAAMGSTSSKVVRNMFPNGALESEYTEVGGKIEGCHRSWYPTGQLFSELDFVNGVKNGRIREWTEGGLLRLSASLKNGVFDGRYESWWDDGKPKEQGEFKDGVRQPGYCWYRMDGTLWQKL